MYYRKTYYEVIDIIVQELSRRFDQASLRLVMQIESTLLMAANNKGPETITVDETILTFYKHDLDEGKLLRKIKMLPDFVQEMKKNTQLKAITTVRSLAEILKSSTLAIGMFSEVVKLLKIFLTIPVTTATAERSFSALRRLKTYLRSVTINLVRGKNRSGRTDFGDQKWSGRTENDAKICPGKPKLVRAHNTLNTWRILFDNG